MYQTTKGNFLQLCSLSLLHTVDFEQFPRRAIQPLQSTCPAICLLCVGTKGSASHLSSTQAQHCKRGQRGQRLSQSRNWGQS
jgi:hypothetical protein